MLHLNRTCKDEKFKNQCMLLSVGYSTLYKSKVFERCVFKDVFNFLYSKNKISKLQAAYNPGNSTEFQLLEIYNIVANALENRKDVTFVFCDISKAFDKVWHEGLLYKLNRIGIGGPLLKWFKSYLEN